MHRGRGHGRGGMRSRAYDDERPLSAIDREDGGEDGVHGK